jgi:hypothetical protein
VCRTEAIHALFCGRIRAAAVVTSHDPAGFDQGDTMSLFGKLNDGASQVLDEVQASMSRAKLEAERRMLSRHHRSSLEALGQRTYELVKTGALPAEPLAPEIAEVDEKLDGIEEKLAQIDVLKDREARSGSAPSGGPGWDAADDYFAE